MNAFDARMICTGLGSLPNTFPKAEKRKEFECRVLLQTYIKKEKGARVLIHRLRKRSEVEVSKRR